MNFIPFFCKLCFEYKDKGDNADLLHMLSLHIIHLTNILDLLWTGSLMPGERFTILFAVITASIALVSGSVCKIDGCIICNSDMAVCDTNSTTGAIPQNLASSMTYLTVKHYSGPPVKMSPAMFKRYRNLTDIIISGNFIGIEPETFAGLTLKYVSITYTNISSLPDDAFGVKTNIRELFLHNNKFTVIPLSLFNSFTRISKLDFSYNPIDICNSNVTSIGEEFAQLKTLMHLFLSGIGTDVRNCTNIGDDFFKPIAHLSYLLNISESCFFTGSTAVLSGLRKIQVLDMSSVYPFTECPGRAGDFLLNLPANAALQKLIAHNWRSQVKEVESDCTIVPKTLQGLNSTKLKNFQLLDFEGCDMAFGKTLPDSMFLNMNSLEKIHLSFTGISHIADNALRGVDIIELYLNGNPFGTRPFTIGSTAGRESYIETLSLSNIGIRSDGKMIYNLFMFISKLPNLSVLDLSDNVIATLPCFTHFPSTSSQFSIHDCISIENRTTSIESLDISGNLLTSLNMQRMETACRSMPELQTFRAESNQLRDVSGLCTTIKNLYLSNNFIGFHPATDFYPQLKLMTQLQKLDISGNSFKYLDPNAFNEMKYLSSVIAQSNPLSILPDTIFISNMKLVKVDFSNCFLDELDNTIDAVKSLPKLEHLYLKYNQFTSFAPSVISVVDNDLKALKTLSLLGNPFDCDCNIGRLQDWLSETEKVIDVINITCGGPEHAADTISIFEYSPPPFRCKFLLPLIIGCAVVGFVLLILLVCLPCICSRWYISHRKIVLPELKGILKNIRYGYKCDYDAVVCYNTGSDIDQQWVGGRLVPALEGDDHQSRKVGVIELRLTNIRFKDDILICLE